MKEIQKRLLTSIFLLIIIYLSLSNYIVLFFVLLTLNYFSLSEFNYIFKNIFKKKLKNYFLSFLICTIYLALFTLTVWSHLIPFSSTSIVSLCFLLLICIFTDVGGFVFGKFIGGKRLTQISPNKTYSGVFGSLFLSIVFGYFYYMFFKNYLVFEINYLFLIVIISLMSQIGDLFISFLKRKAKLKDTGSILPGHGGILDRIDGILIGLPSGLILIYI